MFSVDCDAQTGRLDAPGRSQETAASFLLEKRGEKGVAVAETS